ncbi:GMC oxidoreductase [Chryseosolibacter indicus]|uniref:GMC family oxidoreductase n=1 Tax=Chryseosolibacter indicus TaxID=2782351 RepID=A0ABS5VSS8_9BACT|nr:GMC family oxidoreductase [Chryseosolibacter indicus]MBT1704406.1 GMC family oxidoreductase [Chryseosolibacter indicus]
MNLISKSKEARTYDAIVVGSGISGGWAAKELCESGLKVLMLERGKPVNHPQYPTATNDPWDFPHRNRLTEEEKRISFVQNRHWTFQSENKHFFINDLENPYTEIKRFDWIRADVVGGRSLLWSRHCYRFSDLDFEANIKDGHGIDWPIRYKDLAPWYDYVEKFIGVSGQTEGLAHLPDGHFLPPMEMNCVEQDFKVKFEKKYPDRRVTIGRVANLTQPVKGRGQCQARNLCHRGCPYGAYFSTNASTLPAAHATKNLELLSGMLVNRVLYDEQKERATGVEVLNTETNEITEYYAKIIFLNASTLGTTFILLNSVSNRFPNGLGNGSDQVGRNLMDHHKNSGASASVEGFEDKYYSGRRPNTLYIPRFINVNKKNKDYLRGYGLMGGASRAGWRSQIVSDKIGADLKSAVQTPGPWSINFGGFGECLPYHDNRVTLNTNVKDKWGRNTLSINCEFKDNEKAMQQDMANGTAEFLEELGYKNVKPYVNTAYPGNANHEMGTARMGKDPENSVVNSYNQMHEVKNVFITDGSFMTSSSCVNPSLTYMAITARACAHAINEMKKQNI